MKALVCRETGLVLDQNCPMPIPVDGEALIHVLLTGICNTDLEIVRGYKDFQGVLGHEFVGIVEDIYGCEAYSQYEYLIGKRIVGEINAACHKASCFYCQQGIPTHCPNRTTLGILNRNGTFAEYLTLPIENLHLVPENVSDEEAVFVEPLAANFEILEQVHLEPTENVVILGDGKMGQLVAQVLTLSGGKISMVGKHEEKLALAQKCGVFTYFLEDARSFTLKNGQRADMVIECTGSAQGLEMALRLVRARGTVILKSTVAEKSLIHLAPIVVDEIKIQGSRCGPFTAALRALEQKLVDIHPLISAYYTLDQGISAFQYADKKDVLKVLMQV